MTSQYNRPYRTASQGFYVVTAQMKYFLSHGFEVMFALVGFALGVTDGFLIRLLKNIKK